MTNKYGRLPLDQYLLHPAAQFDPVLNIAPSLNDSQCISKVI